MSKTVEIYTDGACFPNPGVGGWAWVSSGGETFSSGKENPSTNQRMEMMAVLKALESCDGLYYQITIHTDSRFVINGCTEWLGRWKKNNWVTSSGSLVKNQDLWMRLDELLSTNTVLFQWVKGHSGHPMNERADQLAGDATGLLKAERAKFESLWKK